MYAPTSHDARAPVYVTVLVDAKCVDVGPTQPAQAGPCTVVMPFAFGQVEARVRGMRLKRERERGICILVLVMVVG